MKNTNRRNFLKQSLHAGVFMGLSNVCTPCAFANFRSFDSSDKQLFRLQPELELRAPLSSSIRVLGFGDAGVRTVNHMIISGLTGVDFIIVNRDFQSLEQSQANCRIQIGADHNKCLDTKEIREAIADVLKGANMVFIICGPGGGTCTEAALLAAEVARENDLLTVAMVNRSLLFEDTRRLTMAKSGMAKLRERADTLLTIPNDKLRENTAPNTSTPQMIRESNDVLYYGTKGITDLVSITGYINSDFADLRKIMSKRGALALIGTGSAIGKNRAIEATGRAISNPLLGDIPMGSAKGALINMNTGPDVMMSELQDAATMIQNQVKEDCNVIWGWVVDPNAGREFRVTVIATGISTKWGMISV